ncbi:hypothetical protein GJAV_G00145230 [Gymnothorax javanicus]|nr:hypothetical protein GJAV_G00145230 [Gymnothorax javanicus]
MELQNLVIGEQAKRKWENLKYKHKELKHKSKQAGAGTDGVEETAATWVFYAAMDEAIGTRASVTPVNLFASGGAGGATGADTGTKPVPYCCSTRLSKVPFFSILSGQAGKALTSVVQLVTVGVMDDLALPYELLELVSNLVCMPTDGRFGYIK